jgi:carbon monoxide dehydrogenase subunit G
MTTKVEKSIQVDVPVHTAYDQWTQFEDFPHFMGGVKEVRQEGDRRLHWVAEIAGVRREWDAAVLEQVPDEKVAWAATGGATNAGAVRFEPVGAGSTMVHLSLEYEPEGLVEQAGDKLGIVERQVNADLERFKALIEDQGYASGAWRGSVNAGFDVGTPGTDAAASSRGDSGKAGLSATAVVAGAAAAAAGVAAAVAAKSKGDRDDTAVEQSPDVAVVPPPPAGTVVEPPVGQGISDPVGTGVADPAVGRTDVPVVPDDDPATGGRTV